MEKMSNGRLWMGG